MRDEDIKEGDILQIRQWDDMANEFGVLNSWIPMTHKGTNFTNPMKSLCGRVLTVLTKRELSNEEFRYEFVEGTDGWFICSDMLEPFKEDEWEFATDEEIKALFG